MCTDVTLRVDQALACGSMWMAHVGGAHLDERQVYMCPHTSIYVSSYVDGVHLDQRKADLHVSS